MYIRMVQIARISQAAPTASQNLEAEASRTRATLLSPDAVGAVREKAARSPARR